MSLSLEKYRNERIAFVQIFEEAAKKVLGETAIVKRKESLYYSLSLDRKLCLSTPNTQKPKRGSAAFETDICIFEKLAEIDFPARSD